MGRLGDLLRSYLDFDDDSTRNSYSDRNSGDADLRDAYNELNEFLRGGNSARGRETRDKEDTHRSTAENGRTFRSETENRKLPPESLRKDFAALGVAFGADEGTCKTAWKKLLKIHHPDRYAGDEAGAKNAAAQAAGINAAYDNICRWRQ
jgi:curved DNA-binding protein CbpA